MNNIYLKSSLALAGILVLFVGTAQAGAYYSPAALIADSTGSMIYVAESTTNLVDEIDVSSEAVIRTLVLPDAPTGLALSSDDSTLYITAGAETGAVYVVDVAFWQSTTNVSVGHTPMSPVLSVDGNTLYVCNRYNDSVAVIRLSDHTVTDEISLVRQPVAMALSSSQGKLVVANHLPAGAADTGDIACDVSIIDTTTLGVTEVHLPDGSSGARGVCVSPDGTYAYVTHIIGRYKLPTSHVERGWIWRNAISIVDIGAAQLVNTILLDDVELGAANPWGVVCTSDGAALCVTHAGTHELSVIDRAAVHSRLASLPYPGGFAQTAAEVPNDLGFMSGIRTRVPLPGTGPRDVIVIGANAYITEYYSDSVAVVNLSSNRVGSIPLGPQNPMTAERRGEFYFNDAHAGTFQQWLSCASCHPDGRCDGLNWDNANDGYGTPRNAKSMLLAHQTAPAMITGIRPDAETAVRAGFKFIQFSIRDEADAQDVDAYLSSMQPVKSPYRVKGQLSADAQAGKVLFQARCIYCHSDQHYSNQSMRDVGTGRGSGEALDTPTLTEVWRTAPYLQDGRAATVQEVLTTYNPTDAHGTTSDLTAQQINQLAEYVLCLPEPYTQWGPDEDGDTIPDYWESTYFAGNTQADALLDNDGDGFSNLEEWIADTNPTNRFSVLGISSLINVGANVYNINWDSAAGRLYDIETATQLAPSPVWSNVVTDVVGTGGELTVTNAAPDDQRFYRIKVSLPE